MSDPSTIQLSECVVRVPEGIADFGSGITRRLEPIYLDLLLALVRAAGRTLSWKTLERDAWRGRQVKPDALRQRLKRLRKRLSKDGKGDIPDIVTVRGEGLRLAPVGLPDPVGPDIDLDREGDVVWLVVDWAGRTGRVTLDLHLRTDVQIGRLMTPLDFPAFLEIASGTGFQLRYELRLDDQPLELRRSLFAGGVRPGSVLVLVVEATPTHRAGPGSIEGGGSGPTFRGGEGPGSAPASVVLEHRLREMAERAGF